MKNISQVQSALRCTPLHSAGLVVAGCLTLGLLVPGNPLRAAESGEPGEPFLIQTKPDRPGDPVCEVVLDGEDCLNLRPGTEARRTIRPGPE